MMPRNRLAPVVVGDPRYVITLVHGTFAPEAAWVKPGIQANTHYRSESCPGVGCVLFVRLVGPNSHRGRVRGVWHCGGSCGTASGNTPKAGT